MCAKIVRVEIVTVRNIFGYIATEYYDLTASLLRWALSWTHVYCSSTASLGWNVAFSYHSLPSLFIEVQHV